VTCSAVEATLTIVLLIRCEYVHNMFRACAHYRLLLTYVASRFSSPPSLASAVLYVAAVGVHPHILSILGVILLHVLLVPGTAFLICGARAWGQKLLPHRSQLNFTLLAVGSVTLFQSALSGGADSKAASLR